MNSKGSSETTREAPLFNESSFSQNTEFTFQNYIFPQHFSCLDTSFLEWFVGFSEGNANFFLKEEGAQKRLVFEMAQKDAQLIHKIRKQLGYGRVSRGNEKEQVWVYRVEDRNGVQRLMSLFQDNLVLPKRILEFQRLQDVAFDLGLSPRMASFQQKKPSLQTAWLAGFLEAEGCFSAHLASNPVNSSRLHWRQKVTLTQQDIAGEQLILDSIAELFQSRGAVQVLTGRNCYRIEMSSIESHVILKHYLDRFPLRGKKHLTAKRWGRVLDRRQSEKHIVSEKVVKKWKRVCKQINAPSS
jgi:hypothetical protein